MLDEPRSDGAAAALFDAATERLSLLLGLVGIAVGIVAHLVAKNEQGPLWILWYVIIISLVSLWIAFLALKKALARRSAGLPAVKAVMGAANQGGPILLLEPSPLFGTSNLVSIYHRDDDTGYEVLVAHGTVKFVQSNMMIQVQIDEWIEGNQNLVELIIASSGSVLRRIIVRPSVTRRGNDGVDKDAATAIAAALISQMRPEVAMVDPQSAENMRGQDGHT